RTCQLSVPGCGSVSARYGTVWPCASLMPSVALKMRCVVASEVPTPLATTFPATMSGSARIAMASVCTGVGADCPAPGAAPLGSCRAAPGPHASNPSTKTRMRPRPITVRDLLRLATEAHGVVPQQLPPQVIAQVPAEKVVDGIREAALQVRVIRRVHQHVRAHKVDDHLDHVLALGHLDAGEEPPAGHVLADGVLQVRHTAHVHRLVIEPPHPERQPAAPGLEDAEADVDVALHDASADEGADGPHGAPRV